MVSGYRLVSGLALVAVSGVVWRGAMAPDSGVELAPALAAALSFLIGLFLLISAFGSTPAVAPRNGSRADTIPPPLPSQSSPAPGSASSHNGEQYLLGELAVTHVPRLRQIQVEAALQAQRGSRQRLGQILIQRGLLSPAEPQELLALQARLRRERNAGR